MRREHRFFGENQTKQAVDFIVENGLGAENYTLVFDAASICIAIEWDDGVEELGWNN